MIFLKVGNLLIDHFYNFFVGFFSQFAQPRFCGTEGCNGKCITKHFKLISLGSGSCGLLCGDNVLYDSLSLLN